MRQAVSAIFIAGDDIFTIIRNNHLKVFPGYTAFPGGKVDKHDGEKTTNLFNRFEKKITNTHLNALMREIKEELNFDLEEYADKIIDLYPIGVAITPDFNPYRFESFYYVIKLPEKVHFNVDLGEAKSWCWESAPKLLNKYKQAKMLAVPPMIMMLEAFTKDIGHQKILDLTLDYDTKTQVPMIESIYGVKQFLPKSNTFPPASRTNSFLIGDKGVEILIDPSPKDYDEYQKFINSLSKYNVSKIFITPIFCYSKNRVFSRPCLLYHWRKRVCKSRYLWIAL